MNTERIAAIFSIVLAGSTYYMATGYSDLSSFFPKVISVLIILLSIMLLVKSFKKPEVSDWHKEIEYKYLIMLIVGIVVYVIVIPVVGFVPTSIVFISLYSWLLSHNKTPKTAVLGIALALFISIGFNFLFKTIFFVPLPTGILF